MNPQAPQRLDMNLVREALERRRSGQLGGGGTGGTPAMLQRTGAQAQTPTGGMNTPMSQVPQLPNPQPGQLPQQVQAGAGQQATNQALQGAQGANSPQFDPETREYAKGLVQRLLKGL